MSIVVDRTESEKTTPVKTDEAPKVAPKSALESLVLPTSEDIDPTYRGKSAADLIEMHRNATKKIGEQGNEVGVWRGLVAELSDSIAKQRVTSHSAADTQQPVKVTSDELVADPTAAISKLVDARIKDALKPVQEVTARTGRQAELDALERDFPGYVSLGKDERFQQWAMSGNSRKADAEASIRGDLAAARRLLESWNDRESAVAEVRKTVTPKEQEPGSKPQGLEGARKSQTETGGAGGAAAAGLMHGTDIIKLIMNDPDKYKSDDFQKELFAAAKAGRVRL